jgi:hypothetical protein
VLEPRLYCASAIDLSPVLLATRTFLPSAMDLEADAGRLAVLRIGIAMLERWIGISLEMMPPSWVWVCAGGASHVDAAHESAVLVRTDRITSPVRPLSRPVSTTTLSPFLILAAITAPPARAK